MRRPSRGVELPAVADFISLPFYDLFAENGHVPKIRENLPPLLTGVRRSILEVGAGTGLITTSLANWTPGGLGGDFLRRLESPRHGASRLDWSWVAHHQLLRH
jgi:hypothetical protein